MRKLKIFFIVIGTLLLLAGGGLLAVTIVRANNTENKLIKETISVENPFSDIDINISQALLEVKKSTDDKCVVEIDHIEKFNFTVNAADNKLIVKDNDTRVWYEKYFFNFIFNNMKVIIYLPQAEYNDVKLGNTTGATVVEEGFTFNNLNTTSSTGLIKLNGSTIKGELKIHHTTGELEINDTNAKSLIIETSTGETKLKNVIVSENMKIDGSTGSVDFYMCDAQTIQVKLSTGSIRGSLLTGKTFTASSSTGRVNVPNTTGGSCILSTSTGSIDITVQNS